MTKWVLYYFKGIIHPRIIYGTDKPSKSLYNLIEYINNNYVRDLEDCKSIIAYYFFINEIVVS